VKRIAMILAEFVADGLLVVFVLSCFYFRYYGSSSFGVDLIYKGIKSTPNDEEPFKVRKKFVSTGGTCHNHPAYIVG